MLLSWLVAVCLPGPATVTMAFVAHTTNDCNGCFSILVAKQELQLFFIFLDISTGFFIYFSHLMLYLSYDTDNAGVIVNPKGEMKGMSDGMWEIFTLKDETS